MKNSDNVRVIIETQRLYLRELTQADFDALCAMLKDEDVMYAYNGAFSNQMVQEWLDKQLARYETDGFGLWAVVEKKDGLVIGQCGLTYQETPKGRSIEVGYIFNKSFWHCGYATEAAIACRDYAFERLAASEVVSIIRCGNIASQNVAERNSMKPIESTVKHYRGEDMPHTVYAITRNEYEKIKAK